MNRKKYVTILLDIGWHQIVEGIEDVKRKIESKEKEAKTQKKRSVWILSQGMNASGILQSHVPWKKEKLYKESKKQIGLRKEFGWKEHMQSIIIMW